MTIVATTDSWTELAVPEATVRGRVAARIARRLFVAAVKRMDVHVVIQDADGAVLIGRGGPRATIVRPDEFFNRIGRDKLIGLGEAYMTGAWESDELAEFFTQFATHVRTLVPRPLRVLRRLHMPSMPRRLRNTRTGARANIAHHYDLSNDLFATFLDPTMTYSAALFQDPERGWDAPGALEAAQLRKIDRLLDEAGVTDGTRLLEIGSGWGALAIRAAQRGATVRTITLSAEQKELADQRIAAAGLADRVSVDICDYRDVAGTYDAVVSVEMIEAVGHQYWRSYFEAVDRALEPGGRFALQAITFPHDRLAAARNAHTWITKYIFPGGALPSVETIEQLTTRHTAMRPTTWLRMGDHYVPTLRLWDNAFMAATDEVAELGFDQTFRRMWHFYLAYCEGGFAAGYTDDYQVTFVKEPR